MADTAQTSQEQPTEQQPHAAESTPEVVQEEPTVISADDDITSPSAPIFINPSIPTPSSSSVKFTLDDVPSQKWKTRFQEMQAWCFTELQRPHITHSTVIKSFLARLTGFMKDWFDSLGQYRQLQYLNALTVDEFMNALYWEFCGKQDHLKNIAREEFFKLKCCSYNPKDLNKHFENAVRRFYLIGGMDDPNIKQAYLESIPQPLGQETLRVIEMRGQSLGTTSFGELHNMVLRTLKKLCNQRAFLTDIHTTGKKLEKACERPELKVKCTCSQRRKEIVASSVGKGHFAKNCPKQKKTKVLQQIYATTQVDDEADLESLFSEQDEQSPVTIFILEEDPEDNLSSNSDDEFSSDECYGIQIIGLSLSIPMVEVKIFPSKYDKPIIVAGLFDTGAACSILNPTVLPPSMWKSHRQIFQAANNEYFSTEVISKPVTIQFFPNCFISHKLLGLFLPGKDIVIGFDIIQQLWAKKVIPKYNGLQYKSHFLPYIKPTTYFSMSSLHSLTELLIRDCCAESHTDFLTKCTSPLLKNPEFFVSLPFKLNEDANPTKASHTGMSPEHLQLATTELGQLQAEGLIEPTNSQWACQAFYVDKRAEQVRGKMRLVIDYKPLNHFLADDKFPLPNRKALFANLYTAKIFSKFDIKAVMPFGLKTAPSLFQKAITRIYHPIMKSALVYIDDILLFSPDESSHSQLLSDFHELTKRHGVMLSQKKMAIGVPEINFLGMHIKDGQYSMLDKNY
ncbi:Reverse transcriptase domain-containing protein [Abeliophyllum distichum]|uniref:Reverse transcriptase domain-containing protein n=1 Tax=Abeliophyllum distichum TaxID=126358 RepID=A0ABD1SEY0_9LAMI